MDVLVFKAFVKHAGVGYDIHGYTGDPGKAYDDAEVAGKEWYRKHYDPVASKFQKPTAPKPGFFRRMLGKDVPREEKEKFRGLLQQREQSIREALKDAPPEPMDGWEARRGLKIKTPYDDLSGRGYKFHSTVGLGAGLEDYTTDEAYSPQMTRLNLSRKQLGQVIKKYEKELPRHDIEGGQEVGKAFLNKARYLMNNPKAKFVRLEYE